ncbi:MAG: transporter substrate-binding domain-containing protein [Rhodoferax sp.]|nr:transporter substrate-binding domain-containing protein [Rhodoferax sp.]
MNIPTKFSWLLVALLCLGRPGHTADKADTLHFATESFPPFNYEENGAPAGPMLEIILAACNIAQITCTAEIMPWRRALALGENGHVDGIFSILLTGNREKKFFLSDPIIRTTYSFFALKSAAWEYKTPSDLNGMTIAVYGPSGTSETLNEIVGNAQDVRVVLEVTNFDVFKTLALGVYGAKSAILANRDVGLALLQSRNAALPPSASDILPVGEARQIVYGFGLSRQKASNASHMESLNRVLRKMALSGQTRKILTRHGLQAATKGAS